MPPPNSSSSTFAAQRIRANAQLDQIRADLRQWFDELDTEDAVMVAQAVGEWVRHPNRPLAADAASIFSQLAAVGFATICNDWYDATTADLEDSETQEEGDAIKS